MNNPDYVYENLRFLSSEISMQLNHLQTFLTAPSVHIAKHILDRSGYTYNLKIRIQNACRKTLIGKQQSVLIDSRLTALDLIAADLEKISEICRLCVTNYNTFFTTNNENNGTKTGTEANSVKGRAKKTSSKSKKINLLNLKTYLTMLNDVNDNVSMIEMSLYETDINLALQLGKIDAKFKKNTRRLQGKFIQQLQQKNQASHVMLSIGLMNNFTQMGSILLSISETIISAILGQAINTDRYQSLRHAINQQWGLKVEQVNIKTIAETRSGSGISGINAVKESNKKTKKQVMSYDAIFKDGKKKKVKEEKDRVENWHEIYPGLAPRIIDYNKNGDSAAILIEHLQGLTYEQVLFNESDKLLTKTQYYLKKTLKKIWKRTASPEVIPGTYIEQLNNRLANVYALHPEFLQQNCFICGYEVDDFETLLKKAQKFEEKYLKAPFSVYIHGDFNLDNIIFDPVDNKINFIDLHRSCAMDYVQDISVFMVSHYRLQVLTPHLRKRILNTAQRFYQFAYAFAEQQNDKTFNLRLAFALARSFTSSTRFILDKSLADNMFTRSRYLIENVLNTPTKEFENYQLPINKLFTG